MALGCTIPGIPVPGIFGKITKIPGSGLKILPGSQKSRKNNTKSNNSRKKHLPSCEVKKRTKKVIFEEKNNRDFRDPRDPGNFSTIPGTGIPNILRKFPGLSHRDFFSWDGKSRQKATSSKVSLWTNDLTWSNECLGIEKHYTDGWSKSEQL